MDILDVSIELVMTELPKLDIPVGEIGLQNKLNEIFKGKADKSKHSFICQLKAKQQSDNSVSFAGDYAHGPAKSRFIYISWKRKKPEGASVWAQRIKIPLEKITWNQILKAQKSGKPITADVTGRMPHDTKPIVWKV